MYDIYEHLCLSKGIKTCTAVPGDEQLATEAGVPSPVTRELPAGDEITLAKAEGSGFVRRLFFIPGTARRSVILRIYWDGCDVPAVEAPLGDFFASPLNEYKPLSSFYVSRQPHDGLYCTFPMPFKKEFRLTVENIGQKTVSLGYQIGWELCEVPKDTLYFHAQFALSRNLENGMHTMLRPVAGKGIYVGTSILWICRDPFSFNKGTIVVEPDGETLLVGGGPDSYAGTCCVGTDHDFSTLYSGFTRFSENVFHLYRWHLTDPIPFQNSIGASLTAFGNDSCDRTFSRRDDIASVSYFYLEWPDAEHMPLPLDQQLCIE